MDAFAGVILNTIGDMAINIGKTLIGIGIGIDALKASLGSLTGGIAIAAGVALIASGALVKSFAGKLTGAATSATASLGTGGGGVATNESPADVIEPTEVQNNQPQTAVTLNVQGDILDSDETGTRLVSLLNNAFDQKGVVLNASGIA